MNNPTDKSNSPDRAELKALYERHSQIEPDAGLDRMIRARANEAVSQPAQSRSLPWMGGIAMAAVLVLVVGIFYQIEPPVAPPFQPETDSQFLSEPARESVRPQSSPVPVPAMESRQVEQFSAAPSADRERAEAAQGIGESMPAEAGQTNGVLEEDLSRVVATGSRLRRSRDALEDGSRPSGVPDPERLEAVAAAIDETDLGLARRLLDALLMEYPADLGVKALERRLIEVEQR